MVKVAKVRSPLKYAGSKFQIMERINNILPKGKRLVEPFLGSGTVFLNTEYDEYLINDINGDITALLNALMEKPANYIADTKRYFSGAYNNEESYYETREKFNSCTVQYERAVLFLYLNRHGYNGLSRYNKSGGFNVPFGRYKNPYFPEKELLFFAEKLKNNRVTIMNVPFERVFEEAREGDCYYCDPPYLQASPTANFTQYAEGGFTFDDHVKLAELAALCDVPVVISNHDTKVSRKILYANASRIISFPVSRTISCKGNSRKPVKELLVLM